LKVFFGSFFYRKKNGIFNSLPIFTHSLFAKREAKTLIRILRIPAQSAETAVSAGGAGAAPPQRNRLHKHSTGALQKR
jgi:hypothetical protein